MAAIKLTKFLGIFPRTSPELLRDSAAQIAYNVQLHTGDLLPYREPKLVQQFSGTGGAQNSTCREGAITLYGLEPYTDNEPVWLTWTTDVDIAVASDSSDDEQRFYYTGDDMPKVSTYDLATDDGDPAREPYPVSTGFYELGLDAPEDEDLPATGPIIATASSFSSLTPSTIVRDSGNTATLTTTVAHGLRSGLIITVDGLTGSPDADFLVTNAVITVISLTSFDYFNFGVIEASFTPSPAGTVELAGFTLPRTYLFTWYTPWEEESQPSSISEEVFVKEGQTVTITNLPIAPPTGSRNFIRGIRLYRSVVSVDGTEHFLLKHLWFPVVVTSGSVVSNVATVITATPHNMITGDRFKINNLSTLNITDGIVASVVDTKSFTYDIVTGDAAGATGNLYLDAAQSIDDSSRYWGDASFSFIDDFNVSLLSEILPSEDYEKPDSDMIGLTLAQNRLFAGFFDNQLCFAEPSEPHAWPEKYRLTFEEDIVGIKAVGGFLVVLTKKFIYYVEGSSPQSLAAVKVDTPYPCLTKRSIVNMGYGIVFATHGGLSMWSPKSGSSLLTKTLHYWDTWEEQVAADTIVAHYHNDKYFASFDLPPGGVKGGSLIYELDKDTGGYLTTTHVTFGGSWHDPVTNDLYYISDDNGSISRWDDAEQDLPVPIEWRSKVIVTPQYINIGAARVIADHTADEGNLAVLTYNTTQLPLLNASVWDANPGDVATLGGAATTNIGGEVNTITLNGDAVTFNAKTSDVPYPVTFNLWVEKALIFSRTLSNDAIFRLPAGYKSDTFEVSVSGTARIRAIHIGETPDGLRKA